MNDAAIRYFRRREAHSKVAVALKKGALVKLPCWCCGDAKTEAHHYDYDSPLDVVWLCKEHHYQLHTEHTYPQKLPTGAVPVHNSVHNSPL